MELGAGRRRSHHDHRRPLRCRTVSIGAFGRDGELDRNIKHDTPSDPHPVLSGVTVACPTAPRKHAVRTLHRASAVLSIHLGLPRRPEFERLVTFTAEGPGVRVRRTRLNTGLPVTVASVSNLFPCEDFVLGSVWTTALDAGIARDGWRLGTLTSWAEARHEAVSHDSAAGASLERDTSLPAPALDAIPKNLVAGAVPTFIDLRWDLGAPLDVGYLAVRGLVNALTDAQAVACPTGSVPSGLDWLRQVLPRLGLELDDAQLVERLARESRFQTNVIGQATHRDLDWAAATRVPVAEARDAEAEIARLVAENEALRAARAADVAAGVVAEAESARRTNRVIAYVAELHRARDRLQEALDATVAPRWRGLDLPRRLWRALEGRTCCGCSWHATTSR